MGDVVPARVVDDSRNARIRKAQMLRCLIEDNDAFASSSDRQMVAGIVNGFIDRFAPVNRRGAKKEFCAKLWPGDAHGNPSSRRTGILNAKKPSTLVDYINKIATIAGVDAHDLLMEAFRDTKLMDAVTAEFEGLSEITDYEFFWGELAETLKVLATQIVRNVGLEEHLKQCREIGGRYDLADDAIYGSHSPLTLSPLADWNEHVEFFPPIPSIVLFSEPKSAVVDRVLTIRDSGQSIPVAMSVLREVRLAIGPADTADVLAPLFEFRSVLQLVGPNGPLRIRTPWLYLDENEVEVEIDGTWRKADIPFDGGDPSSMPEGFVAQPHVVGITGPRLLTWQFPATLEAPLQFEHCYVVWRPVTAGTCHDQLGRSLDGVTLGPFADDPVAGRPETFCPPGTIANVIEAALHSEAPGGLPELLRAEAQRMAIKVRAFRQERAGAATAAHESLRTRWRDWSDPS
jgi:hypothetical protein